ncbi:MAG: biotin/lipoyl-binding protein [Huintestinicola sp.]
MTKEKKKGSRIVKIIIIVAVLAVLAVIIISVVSSAKMMSSMQMVTTSELEKKDIRNTVSVSGIVESQTFRSVTSSLGYTVDNISVEVGDKVKKGDVLCTLNTDDLRDQIAQQQASNDSSSINTEYSLSDAEKNYNDTLAQYNDGTYAPVRSAKLALDSAEDALKKAQERYNDQTDIAGSDKDSQLVNAKAALESAEKELEYAQSDYDEAKSDKENEDYSDINDLKEAYEDAKKAYDQRYSTANNKALTDARKSYEMALENYNYLASLVSFGSSDVSEADLAEAKRRVETLQAKIAELEAKTDAESIKENYESLLEKYTKAKADIDAGHNTKITQLLRSLERAKANLENAKKTLDLVENGNEISLKDYKTAVDDAQDAVDDARVAYNLAVKDAESTIAKLKAEADRQKLISENDPAAISLEILMKKLDDAVIKAPCDGVVTAVNVTEDSPATGTLFIIEDTENLKLTATVKEYNVGNLKEGLDVKVMAPAIGDREFDGVISKIYPAAVKGMDGKSDGTSSFSIEVLIHGTSDSGMLIGMTGKMTAVTGSAENVFAVGYDALVEESDGTTCIYTTESLNPGTATAKRILVETGFESDAEVEISAPELTEGMSIINNAGDCTDGGIVLVQNELAQAVAQQ